MRFLALYDTTDERGDPRVERAIRDFAKLGEGQDVHSAKGLLLHHVLNHCVEQAIAFHLQFDPVGRRYVLRR